MERSNFFATYTPAELMLTILRRRRVLQHRYPCLIKGACGLGRRKTIDDPGNFYQTMANELGFSLSTIKRRSATAGKLGEALLVKIVNTSFDQNAKLEALAKMPEDKRHDYVDRHARPIKYPRDLKHIDKVANAR